MSGWNRDGRDGRRAVRFFSLSGLPEFVDLQRTAAAKDQCPQAAISEQETKVDFLCADHYSLESDASLMLSSGESSLVLSLYEQTEEW